MKLFKLLLIINILSLLLGCKKDEENQFLVGDIVGFVGLYDEEGIEVEDKSGVEVSISGLSITATTDENGRYELKDVPAGTYILNYSKDDYGVYKIFAYQFVGGNVPSLVYERSMYKQSSLNVKSLDISLEDETIYVTYETDETTYTACRFFLNDSSNVSNLNFDYCTDRMSLKTISKTHFTWPIFLDRIPYSLGDEIYLVVYFYNINDGSGYYNLKQDMIFYSSAKKASDVVSFILE